MSRLIPKEELTCRSEVNAIAIARVLLDEDYVVMISKEEDLYVINYIWSAKGSDRNDVVFMDREIFDDDFIDRHMEDD